MDLQPLVLEGGYKNYRRWVLEHVQALAGEAARRPDWQRKTDLLLALANRNVAVVDLKAWHTTAAAALAASVSPINPVRSTTKTAWSRP